MFGPARDVARAMYALYVGGMGARGKNFYNDRLPPLRLRGRGQARSRTSTSTARRPRPPRRCPTSFIDRVTLIGPSGHVKERIAALREAGVTHLHVIPFGSDTPKLFAQVKEWIS